MDERKYDKRMDENLGFPQGVKSLLQLRDEEASLDMFLICANAQISAAVSWRDGTIDERAASTLSKPKQTWIEEVFLFIYFGDC